MFRFANNAMRQTRVWGDIWNINVHRRNAKAIVLCCALQNENEDAAVDGGRTVADSSFGRVRRLWQGDR